MSLRLKITLALMISSLIAACSVGLVARWMVTRHLGDAVVSQAFRNFQVDMVAFYETYGSWEEAFRREHFSAFVMRRRGQFRTETRTPLMAPRGRAVVIESNPAPLPASPSAPGSAAQAPRHARPPVRFLAVDADGAIIHPVDRSGERVPDGWRATALPIRLDGRVIAYALPQGEVVFTEREQAYLQALNLSFLYAAAITLPLVVIVGSLWGHRLTRPLRRLRAALLAMREGELQQHVAIDARDEIGEVAESFNQTSDRLARAYAELETAKQAAESASRAKSAFLSNMSHELRTPLNAVIGFAQLSRRTPDLPDAAGEHLGIIQKSGEHLLQLINNVLSISRIEAGKQQLRVAPFDLHASLQDILAMFGLAADEKGLTCELEIADSVPPVISSDEGKLRQVVINLLSNAFKFTEHGGVAVSVDFRPPEHLLIAVRDTGSGMERAEVEKLFRPFEQTAAGAQQHTGAGLGLALCKQLVALLGGSIEVESTPGQGTLCRVEVRAEPAVAAPPTADRRQVIGVIADRPPRILVAEDNAQSRRLLEQLLLLVGFDVRGVADGRRAVDEWRAWRPDLIWMDLGMPVMDGFEAARLIHAEATAAGERVVIVALTASVFEDDELQAGDEVFDGLLRKPFREEDLFDAMAEHLELRFRYAGGDDPGPVTPVGPPAPDALASLPAAGREALAKASLEADFFAVQHWIDTLDDEHRPLKTQLRALLSRYDYEALRQLAS